MKIYSILILSMMKYKWKYSILFYPFVNDLIVNNKRKDDEITINSSYLIRYKWIEVKIDDLKEC